MRSSTPSYRFIGIPCLIGSLIWFLPILPAGAQDAYESDNSIATASNIVNGAVQLHTIYAAGDVDYVMFTVVQDHIYHIEMTNVFMYEMADDKSVLTLFDTNKTTVLQCETNNPGIWTDISFSLVNCTAGTYYAKAAANSASATGSYDFTLTDYGAGDGYEVDNSYTQASNITVGVSHTDHTIHGPGDVDYLKFNATAGHQYEIAVTNALILLQTSLYGTDGTSLLATADNSSTPGYDYSLGYYVATAGVYYFEIGNIIQFGTGFYCVVVQDRSAGDGYEIDNDWTRASNIVVGVSQTTRTIHWNQDRDYAKFDAQPYTLYQIAVTNMDPALDVALSLLDSTGTNTLQSAGGGGVGVSAFITNFFYAGGTSYVCVANATGVETGYYSLVVNQIGSITADPYEPDNSYVTASNMVVDTVQSNRTIHQTNDVDYVQVSIPSARRYYRFETLNLTWGLDTYICLYDTNGTTLLASDDDSGSGGASLLDYSFPAPGVYYLKIMSKNSATAGGYSLRVTDTRIRNWWNVNGTADGSPAIADDGTLYIGGLNKFYAFNDNGTTSRVWDTFGSVSRCAPVIGTNGMIYTGTYATNAVYSFNPNGTTNWVSHMTNCTAYWSSLALGRDGSLYVPAYTYRFYSFRTEDGYTNWWRELLGQLDGSSPVINSNGDIFVSTSIDIFGSNLYSFASSGTTNWFVRLNAGESHSAPAIGSNGTIYAVSYNKRLYAIEPDGTTSRVWGVVGNNEYSSPVIGVDGSVYLTSYLWTGGIYTGMLQSFSANGGTNWTVHMTNFSYATPALGSDGTIYIGSKDKNLYAFGANGTTNFIWRLGADVDSSPAMGSNGIVYVGAGDRVYALYGMSTGGLAESAWPMFQHDPKHTGTVPPPIPQGLTASDGTSTDYVQVAWSAVTNATSYQVWRNATNVSSTALLVGESGSTLYNDTSAIPGILYYYWVRAKNHSGRSGVSASETGWRALSPAVVVASDGEYTNAILLGWQSVTGAVDYTVWRASSNDTNLATCVTTSVGTSYEDTAVSPGVEFYYWVRATNSLGQSLFGSADSGWRELSPPTLFVASDGEFANKITLNWHASDGASSYNVRRATTNNSSLSSEVTSTSGTNYEDMSVLVQSGVLYYYWIYSKCSIGSSLPSLVETGWRALSPPANISASKGVDKYMVTITWDAVANATGYSIWRSLTNASSSATSIGASGTTTYYDESAAMYLTYYFWIKATNGLGASAFSGSDSGWRVVESSPSAPTGVSASDGAFSDKVRVTWLAVTNAQEYEVWRCKSNDSASASRIAYGFTTTNYDDTSANLGKLYYYWVKAKNWLATSGFSNSDSGYRGHRRVVVADYDGDGVSDMAVCHTASGAWYIRTVAGVLISNTMSWTGSNFMPVLGDYDGDGVSEPALYDLSSGNWYIQQVDGTVVLNGENLGGVGYVPVFGDFNGDGMSELAVYDTATGNWYIRTVGGAVILAGQQFGGADYRPVSGDFDGDGIDDLAVYNEALGVWYISAVSGTSIIAGDTWGGVGYKAVSGDFNGDGIDDLAVYDTATGNWYIRTTGRQTLMFGFQFGGADYTPVSGDYNGDGISDPAVYTEKSGLWYIAGTNNTGIMSAKETGIVSGEQWGGPGYQPVASPSMAPPGVAPVYRLYSYGSPESTYEHLYTISAQERDALSTWPSWQYEGVAWYALLTQNDDTVPLYRLNNASLRQHHYTIDANEYTILVEGGVWQGEGLQYYVWSTGGNQRLAVYRFYHAGVGSHFFTVSESERDALTAHPEYGWTYEGPAFYVYRSP